MADDDKTGKDSAEYDVTERAGPRVAGRVVRKGESLTLTAAEAEHGLRDGSLVPKGKQLSKAWTESNKALDRMREEAGAMLRRTALPPDEAADTEAAAPAPAADPKGASAALKTA